MAKPICVKKKKMFVKTKWLSAKSCKILAHFDKGELWKVFYGQDNMGLEQLVKSAFWHGNSLMEWNQDVLAWRSKCISFVESSSSGTAHDIFSQKGWQGKCAGRSSLIISPATNGKLQQLEWSIQDMSRLKVAFEVHFTLSRYWRATRKRECFCFIDIDWHRLSKYEGIEQWQADNLCMAFLLKTIETFWNGKKVWLRWHRHS